MTDLASSLPFDLVELVPCPLGFDSADTGTIAAAPLAEVAYREDAWLPRDVADLRAWFAADADLGDIGDALGRSVGAVRTKLGELGLRRQSARPWGELDDAYLAQHHGREPVSAIALAIGRSPSAVYARSRVLDLTEPPAPPYTAWELAQIRAGYDQGVPVQQLATLIGRPVFGVASVAHGLGIRHANAPREWSEAEQAKALELAGTGMRYGAIAQRLAALGHPPRAGRAVGQALRQLGYGRGWGQPWLAEEDELLRRAYARADSLTPLRERLGRTAMSIRWRAGELGLQGTHARRNGFRTEPDWTAAELAIVRRDYATVPAGTLAKRLGRAKGAVYNKAFALGLKSDWMRAFSDLEEHAIRLARDHGLALSDLSAALDRDVAVVSKHAIRMGIPFRTRTRIAPRSPRACRPTITLGAILALAKGGSDDDAKTAMTNGAPPAANAG